MVGNTLVRYFDSNKTYVEARRQCLSLGSQLLEIWNEDEWNEVNLTVIDIQISAEVRAPGLVNFITAVAYHFCQSLPEAFTQPGVSTSAELCR